MKKIVFATALFLLMPFLVRASVTSEIHCKDEVKIGEMFICDVYVTSTETITSFNANIIYPTSVFELKSIIPSSSWSNEGTSSLKLTNDEGITARTKVAVLNFSVKNTAVFGNQDISIESSLKTTDTVKVLSSDNRLKTLMVSNKDFTFISTKNQYNLTTNDETVTISATLADSNSSFLEEYGPREVKLQYGLNNIQVIVKSETGEINTYTLKLTRLDNRSSNNKLSSLTVLGSGLDPIFQEDITTYTTEIDDTVTSITIEANLSNSKASYLTGFGPRTVELEDDDNSVTIQVKAENGDVKAYTININKTSKAYDNTLQSITLSIGSIEFDKNTYEYNVNVANNVDEMIISAVPNNSEAKVEVVGNQKLQEGKNTYLIKVTAKNNSVMTYTVNVNRLEVGSELSTNNYLKDLTIDDYSISFNKDVLTYNIDIKKEDKLNITTVKEDETSVIEIIGNDNLKNGSIIEINVTSENGEVRTYQIKVSKIFSKNNIFLISLCSLLFVIGIVSLLFKDKLTKPKVKKEKIKKNESIPLKGSKLILNGDLSNKNKEEFEIPDVEEPEEYKE